MSNNQNIETIDANELPPRFDTYYQDPQVKIRFFYKKIQIKINKQTYHL